jgi:hypothetical protein
LRFIRWPCRRSQRVICRLPKNGNARYVSSITRISASEATFYRWKQQYGALELDEVKELKALRDKNARLKRLVADQALNIQVLREVNSKNW